MRRIPYLQHVLLGSTAVLFASARIVPGTHQSGPVLTKAIAIATGETATRDSAAPAEASYLAARTSAALDAFALSVHGLSHPRALEDAFKSYYAYKVTHPESVKKPYLYFVDYGQPSTAKRGYVFDMEKLAIVDGPFTVAHGRGSSASKSGVPTRFSNVMGSAATSLGLYVAQETYRFSGKAGGRTYGSVGLRLKGVSEGFNDNARARGVVAHGAPYVGPNGSGRSEGCPAMEQPRAQRLLPKLANGSLVFLFAPNEKWLANDPWITTSQKLLAAAGDLVRGG